MGVVANFVVEGELLKQHSAVGVRELIKGSGLDVLAGGEVELGAHRACIFNADPVNNALVSCAFASGGEVEDVAVFATDFFFANVGGGVVDGVVGAGDVTVGGIAGETFEGCDANGRR